MAKDDSIEDFLDVDADVDEDGIEINIVPYINESIISIDSSTDLTTDYENTRNNMHNLMLNGNKALEGILQVAHATQHPRAFEIVAKMMDSMSNLSKDLISLHKDVAKIRGELPDEPSGDTNFTTNNTLNISQSDLLKLLQDQDGE